MLDKCISCLYTVIGLSLVEKLFLFIYLFIWSYLVIVFLLLPGFGSRNTASSTYALPSPANRATRPVPEASRSNTFEFLLLNKYPKEPTMFYCLFGPNQEGVCN